MAFYLALMQTAFGCLGQLHAVNLGLSLSWFRFGYDGELLTAPARKDLEVIKMEEFVEH